VYVIFNNNTFCSLIFESIHKWMCDIKFNINVVVSDNRSQVIFCAVRQH